MPFIKINTNFDINKEQEFELKRRFGESVSNFGKPEKWLMLEFAPNSNIYFHGDNDMKIAYIDVKLFGNATPEAFNNLTDDLSNIMYEILDIEKQNIYISYYPTEYWGWNGGNF